MEPGGNSGVFLWCDAIPDPQIRLPKGMEVQMLEVDWVNQHKRKDGSLPPIAYVQGELFGAGGMTATPENPSLTDHVSGDVFTSTQPVRSFPLKRSRKPSSTFPGLSCPRTPPRPHMNPTNKNTVNLKTTWSPHLVKSSAIPMIA